MRIHKIDIVAFLSSNGSTSFLLFIFYPLITAKLPSLFTIIFCYVVVNGIIFIGVVFSLKRQRPTTHLDIYPFDFRKAIDSIKFPAPFKYSPIIWNVSRFRKPSLSNEHFNLCSRALVGLKGTKEYENISVSNFQRAMSYLRLGYKEEAKDIVYWAIDSGDITEKVGKEIIERIDLVPDPPPKRQRDIID